MSGCTCKTLEFTVLVTVQTSYEDAHHAADTMRAELKRMTEDVVTGATVRVTTGWPSAADRGACLIGVCER